jgi:hypothetical protein
LIDYTLSHTFPDAFNETCAWFDVHDLPEMAFDHKEIIEKGLEHLRNTKINIDLSKKLPDTLKVGNFLGAIQSKTPEII